MKHSIEKFAKSCSMRTKDITAGMNGYPVPNTGVAIFPDDLFNLLTIDRLLKAFELDNEVYMFHWKDGWDICESRGKFIGNINKGIQLTFEDFGDDYQVIELPGNKSIMSYIDPCPGYNSFTEAREDGISEKQRQQWMDENQELFKEVGVSPLDRVIVLHNRILYNEFYTPIYSFSEDTHHWALGFKVENDE